MRARLAPLLFALCFVVPAGDANPGLSQPLPGTQAAWNLDEALASAPAFQPHLADAPGAATHRASLLSAADTFRILESDRSALDRAFAIAILRGATEAGWLDPHAGHPDVPAHANPSDAILSLLASLGATPTLSQHLEILQLDAQPEPLAQALAATIDAFQALSRTGWLAQTHHDDAHAAQVFLARNALLDAVRNLHQATASADANAMDLDLPPFLRISTADAPNTYTLDYALLIDLGGDDDYHNNAGGASFYACPTGPLVAALVDLARAPDSDVFNAHRATGAWTGNACGRNGGSYGGTGFLVNLGGNDTYGSSTSVGNSLFDGVNGGSNMPQSSGFLLDVGGNDTYIGHSLGINGGAINSASGLLIHLGGNGTFLGRYDGVNGGGSHGGVGLLVAEGGFFRAVDSGVNGGGIGLGQGTLLAQDAILEAHGRGANGGGAYLRGVGFGLVIAGELLARDGSGGANGGADGGAEGLGAWGALIARDATLFGGSRGVNGGGAHAGSGYIFARVGLAEAGDEGTNGGGYAGGRGLFIELGASTTYRAASRGVNGGADQMGTGALVDEGGDDRYEAADTHVNGGGLGGLLLDLAGVDTFDDAGYHCANPGSCTNLNKDGGVVLDV